MDLQLTEKQRRLRDLSREFAVERIRPVAEAAESLQDPAATYPKALVEEASELGLRTITLPEEHGGADADLLTEVIVLEELSYGDPGFGMTMQHQWREGRMLYDWGTPDQHERFLTEFLADPSFVTSLCITEEHFGSDKVRPHDPDDAVDFGLATTAVRDGDDWVINGRKRWMTNGNVSRLFYVAAKTDPSVHWRQGFSVILVPREADGFRNGVVEDKVGLRLNQNAEMIFESCTVPADNLLGPLNGGAEVLGQYRNGGTVKEAAKSIGCARAALEDAEAYSRTRVQGGRLIAGHQTVATSLAHMATKIEAARSLAWRAALAVDQDQPGAWELCTMSGVFATEVVVEVALRAMELQGAHGIRRGTASERNLRNAVCQMHAPASNDVMLDIIHQRLVVKGDHYADPAGEATAAPAPSHRGLL